MLPKFLRIKVGEFYSTPLKPQRTNYTLFSVLIKNSGKKAKYAISVPKSVDKRSSTRNYTRRSIEQLILINSKDYNPRGYTLIKPRTPFNKNNREKWISELAQFFKDFSK